MLESNLSILLYGWFLFFSIIFTSLDRQNWLYELDRDGAFDAAASNNKIVMMRQASIEHPTEPNWIWTTALMWNTLDTTLKSRVWVNSIHQE